MSDDERNKTSKPVNIDEVLRQAKQPLPDFDNPDRVQDDNGYNDINSAHIQTFASRIILPNDIPAPLIPAGIGQSSYLNITQESLLNHGELSTSLLRELINELSEMYSNGTYELADLEIMYELLKLICSIYAIGVGIPSRIALTVELINLPPERLLCSTRNPVIVLSGEACRRYIEYVNMPLDSPSDLWKLVALSSKEEIDLFNELFNSGRYDIIDIEILCEYAKVFLATKVLGNDAPMSVSCDIQMITWPTETLKPSSRNPIIVLSNEAYNRFCELINARISTVKEGDNQNEKTHSNPLSAQPDNTFEMTTDEEWERTLAYYGDYINENEQTHAYNDTTSAEARVQSTTKEIICYADVRPKPVEWLWDNRIPLGKLTLLQGEPGVGKSYLALKLAAEVTKGGALPGKDKDDGDQPVPQGNVIYQSAEDDIADTITPRFLKMSGKRAHLFSIDETEKALTLNDERIKQALETYRPKLMVLDPLAAYLGYNVDINRSNQVRPLFAKLAKWAEEYNCAIVMITHLSKSKFTKGSVYASLGSIDMAAACRCILGVRYIYNTDEKLVYQVKNNVGIKPKPVKFALDFKYGINWRGVFESSKKNEDGRAKAKPKSKLDEAKDATTEMIKKGINTSKAMKREYESKDIKAWAYNRARKELQKDGLIRMSKMKGKYGSKAEAKWEIVELKADTKE